jgi:hypothetical protein
MASISVVLLGLNPETRLATVRAEGGWAWTEGSPELRRLRGRGGRGAAAAAAAPPLPRAERAATQAASGSSAPRTQPPLLTPPPTHPPPPGQVVDYLKKRGVPAAEIPDVVLKHPRMFEYKVGPGARGGGGRAGVAGRRVARNQQLGGRRVRGCGAGSAGSLQPDPAACAALTRPTPPLPR